MKDKGSISNKVTLRNKQARFNYEILDEYIAGMVLKGTEIKSLRMGKANLNDGHCYFSKGELYVKGLNISAYEQASFANHDPVRERKLLLKKKELTKLEKKLNEKGLTVVPLKLFINERGFAKLLIGLAKGKKIHDKRDSIRDKDMKRELERKL